MPAFQVVVRYGVFPLFVLSALVALASWLVRTRRLSPFGPVGRALRGATEPVLRPVERRLVRLGGNPVHAGWWLVVVVAAGGPSPAVLIRLMRHNAAPRRSWTVPPSLNWCASSRSDSAYRGAPWRSPPAPPGAGKPSRSRGSRRTRRCACCWRDTSSVFRHPLSVIRNGVSSLTTDDG